MYYDITNIVTTLDATAAPSLKFCLDACVGGCLAVAYVPGTTTYSIGNRCRIYHKNLASASTSSSNLTHWYDKLTNCQTVSLSVIAAIQSTMTIPPYEFSITG